MHVKVNIQLKSSLFWHNKFSTKCQELQFSLENCQHKLFRSKVEKNTMIIEYQPSHLKQENVILKVLIKSVEHIIIKLFSTQCSAQNFQYKTYDNIFLTKWLIHND